MNRLEKLNGLNEKQIFYRENNNKKNIVNNIKKRSIFYIFFKNFFTLFNIYNLIIFIILIIVGAYKNSLFFGVIVVNFLLYFVQEVKTNNILNSFDLFNRDSVKLLRNNYVKQYNLEDVVLNDIILYEKDQQVLMDSKVIRGTIEINESIITGESKLIKKNPGDIILAGSIIISGKCVCEVVKLIQDTTLYRLEKEAREKKYSYSHIKNYMNIIIKYTTILIPFIFIFLVYQGLCRNESLEHVIVKSSSAVLGMLPKGIILLFSIYSSIGIYNLAKHKILVREINSLEPISYSNIMFLDKTGTLTTGNLSIINIIYNNNFSKKIVNFNIRRFLYFSDIKNFTIKAMVEFFGTVKDKIFDKIEFTSERAYSTVSFDKDIIYILSSPELINTNLHNHEIKQQQKKGNRVLIFSMCRRENFNSNLKKIKKIDVLSILIFGDELRKNIKNLINYLYKQDFNLKILSGDNYYSVKKIAERCNIKIIETDKKNDLTNNIFARMSPEKKNDIILQARNKFKDVIMIGDGANDIMALNQATCSIAISGGSNVVEKISDLVITDGDFLKVKYIIEESRIIVNCINKIGRVFFIKTIYSFLISIFCIILNVSFPFIPLQIILVDIFIEGYPAFLLFLEKDISIVKKNFFENTFGKSIFNALYLSLFLFFLMILNKAEIIDINNLNILSLLILSFFSFLTLYQALKPFNKYRIIIFFSSIIFFIISNIFIMEFAKS